MNINIFNDRIDAGKQLSERLMPYKGELELLILALPRGGVPVAFEVAKNLNAPMNVFLVRKLGVPGHEEVAMGAIAESGLCVLDQEIITRLSITKRQIEAVLHQETLELQRRLQCYREGKSLPCLTEKTIILVDDGIATGSTCKAAILALKTMKAKKIIVAAPVASQKSFIDLSRLVDKVICVIQPEPFYGVGQWYKNFDQTSDDEVMQLLHQSSKNHPTPEENK